MFFRYISFIFSFVFSLSSALYAVNDDLCIAYRVPPCVKQKFFNAIIDQTIPGKVGPDPYHVTLMIVKDTKLNPQHHNALKAHLLNIRDQSLANAHFTPGSAVQLLPANAIVIESNDVNEIQQFKQINSLLYSEVIKFNLQHNTAYQVQPFLEPQNYKPHLTIALAQYITTHGLNPQQVIQDVNLKLANYRASNGAPFDLLQPTPLPQAPGGPQAPGPRVKLKQARSMSKRCTSTKHVAKLKHIKQGHKHKPVRQGRFKHGRHGANHRHVRHKHVRHRVHKRTHVSRGRRHR